MDIDKLEKKLDQLFEKSIEWEKNEYDREINEVHSITFFVNKKMQIFGPLDEKKDKEEFYMYVLSRDKYKIYDKFSLSGCVVFLNILKDEETGKLKDDVFDAIFKIRKRQVLARKREEIIARLKK